MNRIKKKKEQKKKLYEEIEIIEKELKELEVTSDDLPNRETLEKFFN